MKLSDYTKEQQEAITKDGSSIIVSAGAGSGKTQVLTQRVVHFICEKGYHLKDFLILTFTEAAAAEMKERIRKALMEIGSPEVGFVDTADICTFDAYALKIVRKNHFLIHKSKDISLIDSNIIEVRKSTLVDEIFEKMYESHDQVFEEIIARFCYKDDIQIKNLVLTLYNKAIKQINPQEYLDTFVEKFYDNNIIDEITNSIINEVLTQVSKVFELALKLPAVSLKKTDSRLFCDVAMDFIKPLANIQKYEDIFDLNPGAFPYSKPRNIGDAGTIIDEFKKAYSDLQDMIVKLPLDKSFYTIQFEKYKEFAATFIDLANLLNEKIMAYKDEYQVYEFADIAKFALDLVMNNQDIRNNIKDNLKMIMIDEYQDNSVIQEVFINQIANNNVFYVGDIKQSIYRFRDAKCEIFANKYDEYKAGNGGYAIDLNTNFRSRSEVLDDINFIFKQIMTKECGGADYLNEHMILFGNKAYDHEGYTGDNHHLEILSYAKEKGTNKVDYEIELIAEDIIDKLNKGYLVYDRDLKGTRPCTFKDFCVIIDRGTSFDAYSKAFNKYHIPLHIEADEDIKNNELVSILKNLLTLMVSIRKHDYESSEFVHAFLSVSRSFIYQLSDNDLYLICKNKDFEHSKVVNDISHIMYEYSYLSDAELFNKVVYDLDLYHKIIHIGKVGRYASYLDFFTEQIKEMAKLDYSLQDFVVYLDCIAKNNLKLTIKSCGESVNSVNLMNIHKSKGLEFGIVYFPGLDCKFNEFDIKADFNVSDYYGLVLPSLDSEAENQIKKMNAAKVRKEDVAEKVRLLYVALTRTKEKIILVTQGSDYQTAVNNAHEEFLEKLCLEGGINPNEHEELFKLLHQSFVDDRICLSDYLELMEMIGYRLAVKEDDEDGDIEEDDEDDDIQEDDEVDETDEIVEDDENNIEHEPINYKDIPLDKYHYVGNEEPDYCFSIAIQSAVDAMGLYLEGVLNKSILEMFLGLVGISIDDGFYLLEGNDDVDLSSYVTDYRYDDENIDDEFKNNFLECYNHSQFDDSVALMLFRLFYGKIPFENYIQTLLKSIFHGQYDVNDLAIVLSSIGYDCNPNLNDSIDIDDSESSIIQVKIVLDDILIPEKTLFADWFANNDNPNYVIEKIYKLYLNDLINYEKLVSILNLLGYEINSSYSDLSLKPDLSDFVKIICHKGSLIDVSKCSDFYEFLKHIIDNRDFKEKTVIERQTLLIKYDKIDYSTFIINEINYKPKKIEIFHASKQLKLTSNKSNMDYGTNLHLIMETIDLKNPNYDDLSDNEISVVQKFLNTELMNNIMNGEIYQEYEFFDDVKKVSGVIDLMVVYDDHIDIIDYKTKNIDDDEYDKQVKIYADYINRVFNKPINKYLYSLIDGEYRIVK